MTLHQRVASLGPLTGKTLGEIAAVCGEPSRTRERVFTDIGAGRQAVWRRPLFSFCLNFDGEDRCCGIYYTHDIAPYVLVLGLSVLAVGAGALLLRLLF